MSKPAENAHDQFLARLRATIGVPDRTRVSHPVTESDIRRWVLAVYFPERPPRQFWDTEFAQQFGGIIAPAEFNPFAWSIDPGNRSMVIVERGPSGASLNGGNAITYGVPIRPGDVISAVSTPITIEEKQGQANRLILYSVEDVWTNQRGEFVKRVVQTQILY